MAGGASAGPPAAYEARLKAERPDRWLASRFVADPIKRGDLVAFWAFAHELDRARRVVSNDLIAEIRLTWWREALDEIAANREPRAAELVLALQEGLRRGAMKASALDDLIGLHLNHPSDMAARCALEAQIAGTLLDAAMDAKTLEIIGHRIANRQNAGRLARAVSADAAPAVLEAALKGRRQGPLALRWRLFLAYLLGRF